VGNTRYPITVWHFSVVGCAASIALKWRFTWAAKHTGTLACAGVATPIRFLKIIGFRRLLRNRCGMDCTVPQNKQVCKKLILFPQ